jgi:hypothetical protein
MPSINLAELRVRTQELAGLLPDAPAFRAGVRALLEAHAHRLLRRGPSMAKRGALRAWDVPGMLLRELESALRSAAAANPEAALAAADALWPDGRLEERVIAAQLSSASMELDSQRERVDRWIAGLEDPVLARVIAMEACLPLRRGNATLFRAGIREWTDAPAASLRRFGWMALRAWLADETHDSVLAAFDLLPRALREIDPETLRVASEILPLLARSFPAETQRWLDDLPPDLLRRGRLFFRAAQPALPMEFAGQLQERLRPAGKAPG